MPIVSSVVKADLRPKDGSGMVIAEFTHDDGVSEQAAFEAHSSDDLSKRLSDMIPAREAGKAVADKARADAEVYGAAAQKVEEYVKALPDEDLLDAGLTQEEIDAVKGKGDGDSIAELASK